MASFPKCREKKTWNNSQFNAHFIVKLRQIDFGSERIFLSHSIAYFVEFHNFQYIYSFLIEKLWPQQVWILFLLTDDGKNKLLLDFFFTRVVCNNVTYRLVFENHMWLWPDKFVNNFVDRYFNRNNRSNSCNMCIAKLDPLHLYESTENGMVANLFYIYIYVTIQMLVTIRYINLWGVTYCFSKSLSNSYNFH